MDRMVGHPLVIAIIQARMSSSRLPGKSVMDLCGKTLLERTVDRTRRAGVLDGVWLATSNDPVDDVIEYVGAKCGVPVYRGDLHDVLGRYVGAVLKSGARTVVRVTADNPLTEPRFIDIGVEKLVSEELDYLCFTNMPFGSGVEVFTRAALLKADTMTDDAYDREHVCPYFLKNTEAFRTLRYDNPIQSIRRPDVRVTLDTLKDYVRLFRVFRHFSELQDVPLEEAIRYLEEIDGIPVDPSSSA